MEAWGWAFFAGLLLMAALLASACAPAVADGLLAAGLLPPTGCWLGAAWGQARPRPAPSTMSRRTQVRAWLPGPARLLGTLAMVLGMVGVVMVESQLIAGVADAGGTPLLRWLTEGLGLVLLGLAASRWRARRQAVRAVHPAGARHPLTTAS